MTFLEAMKTRRPMRRASTLTDPPWLHLGVLDVGMSNRAQWRRIDTGEPIGLFVWDYEATDWEVMK